MFQLPILFEDEDSAVFRFDITMIDLLNGPMDREWGIRTASFRDPGGQIWEIMRPLGSCNKRGR